MDKSDEGGERRLNEPGRSNADSGESAVARVAEEDPTVAARLRVYARRAVVALFWIWVPLILVPGAYLLGGHLLGLPQPTMQDSELARAVQGFRAPTGWTAIHVLYANCKCSKRILDHLSERGTLSGFKEVVLVATDADELRHEASSAIQGFQLENIPRETLSSKFHIESAPLLILIDDHGVLRYVGGYTDHKQSPRIEDVAIAEKARVGTAIASLPIFGCAVSQRLRAAADPLGLRN